MPDFTQLIEQSFFAAIKAFLAKNPGSAEEYAFQRQLDEQGVQGIWHSRS